MSDSPMAMLTSLMPTARSTAPKSAWLAPSTSPARPLFPPAEQVASVSAGLSDDEIAKIHEEARVAGHAEGDARGWAEAQAPIAAALAGLADSLARVDETARSMARPWAAELVELALTIARELVGGEIRRDPTPLVALVENCLAEVAGESRVVIKMNPADRAALLAARPELIRSDVRVLEEPTLGRGGCIVESARRVVDASVEERLDGLRDGLRALVEEVR